MSGLKAYRQQYKVIYCADIRNHFEYTYVNYISKEHFENDIDIFKSAYNVPLWIVPKILNEHTNKRWRIVIDYRALNEKSLGYPLHTILEILDQLGTAKYRSDFGVASEFY